MKDLAPILLLLLLVAGLTGLLFYSLQSPKFVPRDLREELTESQENILKDAEAALAAGLFDKAFEMLQPLATSKNLRVQLFLAEASGFLGKPAQIDLGKLEQEVSRERSLELIFHLARAFQGTGNPKKAVALFESILPAKIPVEIKDRIQVLLMDMHLAEKDWLAAFRVEKSRVQEKPGEGERTFQIVQILVQQAMTPELDELVRLLGKPQGFSMKLLTFLAASYRQAGNLDQAIQMLEIMTVRQPENPKATYELFCLYDELGKSAKALKTLETVCAGDMSFLSVASQAHMLYQGAVRARAQNDRSRAFLFLRKALIRHIRLLSVADEAFITKLLAEITGNGSSDERAFGKALTLFVNGDFQMARQEADTAISGVTDPELKKDLSALSAACRVILEHDESFLRIEREKRRQEEAARQAKLDAGKKPPERTPTPAPASGPTRINPGVAEAQRLREKLPTMSNNPSALIRTGNRLCDLEDFDGAQEAYQEALRVKPGLPEANFGMGRALRAQKRYPQAVEFVRKALVEKSTSVKCMGLLALLAVDQGDMARGETEARAVLAKNPTNPDARLALARRLFEAGRFEEAQTEVAAGLQTPDRLIRGEMEALNAALQERAGKGP
jgi:tetratricopeptide (TPR) repeat protein